ncbi:MAG TPA: hypothetical protein VF226_08755 [Hyphomicrobiaceae bacterium]
MALVGSGVLGVWHGVAPGMERMFDDWYNAEHHAERIGIDGFLRGRRYINLRHGRRYFCRYDVEDVSVLASPAYLAALNNPTERSRRKLPHFRSTLRGAYRVTKRHGWADGGYAVVCRFGQAGDDGADPGPAIEEFTAHVLDKPAVTAVEYWEVEPEVTNIASEEKFLRKALDIFPARVLVIDGSDPDAMEAAIEAAPHRHALDGAEMDFCKLVYHAAKRA